MTLGERAEQYLRDTEDNKEFAERRRIFRKFWEKIGKKLEKYEIKSPDDDVAIKEVRSLLHNYVRSLDFEDRLSAAWVINDFFEGFENVWRKKCQGYRSCRAQPSQPMCMIDKYMDSTEKMIFMLKYLQGGEQPSKEVQRTQKQIAEYLGTTKNTVSTIWGSLQNGLNLLGSDIKITRPSDKGNNYDNTVHPVFLALNLTEAFFLTEVLRRTFDEDARWQDVAADIAYDVRRQLSKDYCTGQMDRLHRQYYGKEDEIDFKKSPSGKAAEKGYRPEQIDEKAVWRLGSLEKLGEGRNVVVMKLKGEDEIYHGSVHYNEEEKIWSFECDDGRRIDIPPSEALEMLKIPRI